MNLFIFKEKLPKLIVLFFQQAKTKTKFCFIFNNLFPKNNLKS